jgi:hypothetical protein
MVVIPGPHLGLASDTSCINSTTIREIPKRVNERLTAVLAGAHQYGAHGQFKPFPKRVGEQAA